MDAQDRAGVRCQPRPAALAIRLPRRQTESDGGSGDDIDGRWQPGGQTRQHPNSGPAERRTRRKTGYRARYCVHKGGTSPRPGIRDAPVRRQGLRGSKSGVRVAQWPNAQPPPPHHWASVGAVRASDSERTRQPSLPLRVRNPPRQISLDPIRDLLRWMAVPAGFPIEPSHPILEPIAGRGKLNFGFGFGRCPVAHCGTESPQANCIHDRTRLGNIHPVFVAFQHQRSIDPAVDAHDKAYGQLYVLRGIEDGIGSGQGLRGRVGFATARLSSAHHFAEESAAHLEPGPRIRGIGGAPIAQGHVRTPYIKRSAFRWHGPGLHQDDAENANHSRLAQCGHRWRMGNRNPDSARALPSNARATPPDFRGLQETPESVPKSRVQRLALI